ncbi:uncharacterized protein LOC120214473 isoform X2 [Hibiscus syriacus]|uniref:uncharacterized protein LOC120214473 isoform X2 n=1 Tax=Hibiscus syriacus TaxID=106335 RepID=UPI001922FE15|nr:uncharacterized protein LOC120214473 isoform X2 [Hibiscus syriacus]
MGLNETFSSIRSQILLLQPLPCVNHAYSMILQEESNRINLVGRGHKKDQCYWLIGFPSDFKFTKRKQSSAALVTDENTSVDSVPTTSAQSFTPTQYQQVLALLQSTSVPAQSVSTANMSGTLKWKDDEDW